LKGTTLSGNGVQKRLSAILAADVAGYTRLMEEDSDGTVAAWRAARADVIDPCIAKHLGRIVKHTGDGFLTEFATVQSAVECAISLQGGLSSNPLEFRMGVNLGDIIDDGEDIHGEGVNIAARIEALADPGGISISGGAYDQIRNRIDHAFEDMGEHEVKHVSAAVRVYRVVMQDNISAETDADKLPLPEKPSIAVLPFANMSNDPDQDYFADGLTEDIITAMAYVPWIFVIARNSSFTYKGAAVDVRKVGQELGVRYVLEGSVRRQGQRLRVTGQLINAETGAHIWAEKFDGAIEDVFEVQDRLTEAVVSAIAPTIHAAEMERASRKQTKNLDAYDLYLKALVDLNRGETRPAAEHLDQAIALAPDYAKAMAIRAWCNTVRVAWNTGVAVEEDRRSGIELALKSLELDNADLEVASYAGYTLGFFGADIERGFALLEEVTEKCPSFAWAWTSRAMLEGLQGDGKQALKFGQIAQRLSPKDPQKFRIHVALASAYQSMGNEEETVEQARLGLLLNPNIVALSLIMIVNLVKLGRVDDAHHHVRLFLSKNPDFQVSRFIDHKRDFRTHQAGLAEEKAILLDLGMPE
jgi:adenylate cyclase